MAIISMSEASRRWVIGRTNLYRAVKKGRLNLSTRADGSRGIDTSELVRVFGEPSTETSEDVHNVSGNSLSTPNLGTGEQTGHLSMVGLLQDQVNQLSAQLEQSNEREARLLSMLEVEQAARRDLETKLLPAPAPPKPAPPRRVRLWLLLILLVAVVSFAGWRWWDAIRAAVAALVN